MIDFACSACRKKLRVKDESAGKIVKCPGCGQRVAIPALAASRTPEPGPSRPGETFTTRISARPAPDATVDSGPPTHSDGELSPAADFLAPPQAPGELGRLGPFRVLKILGQGGMGMVFQAEDIALERMVALKTLLPALAANAKAKERFLREARSAAKIEHEHIISIYRVDEDRGVPYLAMPLLQGQPLDAILKDGQPVAVREAARIGREIADGLAAAHAKGMIHRDIKPGNIWLEGDRRKVKILDFGLARAADDIAHLTQSGAIVGTPAYMAPEQARGAAVDARADLFSLGCILYQMTTGRKPFTGSNAMAILSSLALDTPAAPLEINEAVAPELSDIVMQLLAKNPEDRFASAADVAEALRAIEDAAQSTVVPRSPKTVVGRRTEKTMAAAPRPRSRRGLYAGIGVICVAVLAAAAFVLPQLFTHEPAAPEHPAKPAASKTPDLAAAEWILRQGGNFQTKDGAPVRSVDDLAKVPPGFQISAINLEYRPVFEVEAPDALNDLRSVEALGLDDMTNAGFEKLAKSKLAAKITALAFRRGSVQAEGLVHLKAFPRLNALTFGGVRLVDADLEPLRQLPVRYLELSVAPIGDDGLMALAAMPNLESLAVAELRMTEKGMETLGSMKRLTTLQVAGKFLTDSCAEKLKASTNLTSLLLTGGKLGDAGLAHLTGLTRLQRLEVTGPITDAGMVHVKKLSKLTTLSLTDTQLGDAGLKDLEALKNLQVLHLEETKVTADGLRKLAAALPECTIHWNEGVFKR